jgi:23S rRNA (guanosine2251-2'-O)-methyltransferase
LKTERLIGIHPVESALDGFPGQVRRLLVAAETKNARALTLGERAAGLDIRVERRPRSELDRLSDGQRHQDVVAEFEPANLHGEKELDRLLDAIEGTPLVLVLDGVQDPHNLGACLRSADAAGVGLVILPRDGSSGLTPVARRAAAGAAEVMPILLATNLARVLRRLKDRGLWLAGTTDRSEQDLYQANLGGPLALVMGAEEKGLRRLTREHCDQLVKLPMVGTVQSLNVSVSAGVCLYEALRQRKAS